jgi:hypothetical protein
MKTYPTADDRVKANLAERAQLKAPNPLAAGFIPLRMDSDDWLVCPGCGHANLHHHEVEVFARREDRETVALTINAIDSYTDDGFPEDDPSSRRQGVAVKFWCEICKCLPELTVAQHKGSTSLGWRGPLVFDITMAEFFERVRQKEEAVRQRAIEAWRLAASRLLQMASKAA